MAPTEPTSALSRTPIADAVRVKIQAAFQAVPQGKRGALLIVADETGTHAHLAAKIGDTWKVAGGVGFEWGSSRPSGYVAVEKTW